ncbi:MAG: EamA family transporter [Saprospiraceae bacterium]
MAKAYWALAMTCIIWGTTYLVNKLGVNHIPPFLFTAVRHSIAGVCMLSYVFFVHKEKWPDFRFIRFQILLGFLLLTIGNGVGVFGLKYIDSGLSAILAATSPITIALLVHFYKPEEKISSWGWVGLLMGFAGLVIICIEKITWPLHRDDNFIGIGLTLISVLAWGIGTVVSKTRTSHHSPFMAAGFQMIFGAIPLVIGALFSEDHSGFVLDTQAVLIWIYIIILGSLVAYTAYIYALRYLPAPIVSIQSYINPIIAMNLGVIFLNEIMSTQLIVGAVMTLIGVFIINFAEQRRKKILRLKDIEAK